MIGAAIVAMLSCPLLMLRIAGNGGSFPRPLSAEEERKYVALSSEGNIEARNILIERNLRLVAHIIKKGYPSRKLFLADYGRNEV